MRMIDLAAVAERINALDGWSALVDFEMLDTARVIALFDDEDVEISGLGDVTPVAFWQGDLRPLLPVLQIVAEARGE